MAGAIAVGVRDGKRRGPGRNEILSRTRAAAAALSVTTRFATESHDHYAEIRDLALTANRDEIRRMSIATQVTVLGVRVRVKSERLKEMSGHDLFVHAVDKGWIGKNSASDQGIIGIVVTDDHARAEATKAGKPVGQYMHFIKEDGEWRLDMMQLMNLANGAFDALQRQSGVNAEEFVTRIIETVISRRLTSDDWNAK